MSVSSPGYFKYSESLQMEIIWRLLDKVPDEYKLPSKILELRNTPDGILLWRKAYVEIRKEQKLAREVPKT